MGHAQRLMSQHKLFKLNVWHASEIWMHLLSSYLIGTYLGTIATNGHEDQGNYIINVSIWLIRNGHGLKPQHVPFRDDISLQMGHACHYEILCARNGWLRALVMVNGRT